jgi:Nicotinate phosphoribosyltransferase (NAPRTase) N-terminal domain
VRLIHLNVYFINDARIQVEASVLRGCLQDTDMDPARSPLLTDLYQLNMIQAYLDHGETKTAVFEFFVRKLPAQRGFLMAAGLEPALFPVFD